METGRGGGGGGGGGVRADSNSGDVSEVQQRK